MSAKYTRARRRAAALKGWRTRRANERARSLAAKRGWATRRRNAGKRQRKAATKPKPKLEQNYEWIVTFRPSKDAEKQIDYIVVAPTEAEALTLLSAHLHNGNLQEHNMAGFVVVEGIARGHATSERAGKVSYRGEPDEE